MSRSSIICPPHQTQNFVFQSSILQADGPKCPGCQTVFGTASLQTQLVVQIREHISKYYEGWTVCDDPTCGNRTRMMGVYGRRCLRQGCRGTVAFEVSPPSPFRVLRPYKLTGGFIEYSDASLYNQLRYYHFLFNAEKAVKAAMGTSKLGTNWHNSTRGPTDVKRPIDEVTAVTFANGEFLRILTDTVERYMDQCGRRWVELSSIFSFMKM